MAAGLEVAQANIRRAAQAGARHGARGLLLTAWGDNGHHQPWPTLFAPLICAAQAAWDCPPSDTQLPAQIDALFYPGAAHGHGRALCALGAIDALLPQPAAPNSFLHSALFASDAQLGEWLADTPSAALDTVIERLHAIATEGIDPEITLGVTLNRVAAQRCQQLQRHGHSVRFLDAALRAPIAQFAQQWNRRSRSGGLSDSLARLRAAGRDQ